MPETPPPPHGGRVTPGRHLAHKMRTSVAVIAQARMVLAETAKPSDRMWLEMIERHTAELLRLTENLETPQ